MKKFRNFFGEIFKIFFRPKIFNFFRWFFCKPYLLFTNDTKIKVLTHGKQYFYAKKQKDHFFVFLKQYIDIGPSPGEMLWAALGDVKKTTYVRLENLERCDSRFLKVAVHFFASSQKPPKKGSLFAQNTSIFGAGGGLFHIKNIKSIPKRFTFFRPLKSAVHSVNHIVQSFQSLLR